MKTRISIGLLALFAYIQSSMQVAIAQNFSATVNIVAINTNNFTTNRQALDVQYDGGFSGALNLRVYTKHRWAIRVGGGIEQVNYTLTNSTSSSIQYEGQRQDVRATVGVEKHVFFWRKKFNAYGGAYLPVVFVGNDQIKANYNDILNNNNGSGLGIVLGGNMRLAGVRLGLEYNWDYTTFRTSVWDNATTLSGATLHNTNKQFAVTVGILL